MGITYLQKLTRPYLRVRKVSRRTSLLFQWRTYIIIYYRSWNIKAYLTPTMCVKDILIYFARQISSLRETICIFAYNILPTNLHNKWGFSAKNGTNGVYSNRHEKILTTTINFHFVLWPGIGVLKEVSARYGHESHFIAALNSLPWKRFTYVNVCGTLFLNYSLLCCDG